jgi:hypothetical protein
MALWKTKLMLDHKTAENIPIIQNTGIIKSMNRHLLLSNKWLTMILPKSMKNNPLKQLTLVMNMKE